AVQMLRKQVASRLERQLFSSYPSLLMLIITFPLQRDSGARAARNFRFFSSLAFLLPSGYKPLTCIPAWGTGAVQSDLFLRPTGAWCSRSAEARPNRP